MKIIDFNFSKEYFEKDRNNELEVKIARFDLEIGDIIRFHEVNENGEPTGKFYDKKVRKFHKTNAPRFWDQEDAKKYGIYVMDLELQ